MHIKFKNSGTNLYQAIVIMLKNMDIILLIFFIRFIIFIIPFALLNAQTNYEIFLSLLALTYNLYMEQQYTTGLKGRRCKFLNGSKKLFFSIIAMLINQVCFQRIKITFYRSIIIWISCFAHTPCYYKSFAKFSVLVRSVLTALASPFDLHSFRKWDIKAVLLSQQIS